MGWLDFLRPAPAMMIADAAPADERGDLAGAIQRLDSTINPLTGMGDARVDKGAASRPGHFVDLTDAELSDVWRSNGYMRRAISVRAGACTRAGWRVVVEGEDDDPIAQRWREIGVFVAMRQALALAMLRGGALILLVTDDLPAGRTPMTELRPGATILRLIVLESEEFGAGPVDDDLTSPNYRRPKWWHVTPAGGMTSMQVHHSRVLYVDGEQALPTDRPSLSYLGQSWVDIVWRKLSALDMVDNAGAILAQEAKQSVLKLAGLEGLQTEDAAEVLRMRIRSMMRGRSTIGALVLDAADEFSSDAGTVTGYRELHEAAMAAFSAVCGIPQVRLFGIAPAGMSSDDKASDRNFREEVVDVQEERLRPVLESLARLTFAAEGGEPDGWALDFNPLDEPTEREWAEIEEINARTDATRIQSGVLDADHVARSRYGSAEYGTRILPLSDEDLDAMSGALEIGPDDLELLRGQREIEADPEPSE